MSKHTDYVTVWLAEDRSQAALLCQGSRPRFFIASVMCRRCVGLFFDQLAPLLLNLMQTLELGEDIIMSGTVVY